MARTIAFDRDEVLDKAAELFRERGYEATSTQDLVEHMGIARASLYNTFGDKHQLFLAALQRYQDIHAGEIGRMLQTEPALLGIRKVFEFVGREAVRDPRGCLVINTTMESPHSERDIQSFCEQSARLGEMSFRFALERARLAGELPPGANIAALARFLHNAFLGLRTLGHTHPSRETVQDVIETTLAALR
jgi:TetR/AcrR family transcriptional repressor of nem operon